MFRENKKIYYRPDCNDTNHADKIVRQPKKKALLDTKQYYLNAAKRRLCHVCHVDPDNHKEIESIKRKIRKLEREIETIQSMEIQHKNLHKCKKLNPDEILDYCIRVLENSKKTQYLFHHSRRHCLSAEYTRVSCETVFHKNESHGIIIPTNA